MDATRVGLVEELWRYPVSSVGGERLDTVELSARGVPGDRTWCLIDSTSGKPVTPESDQRWRPALFLQSRLIGPDPEIGFPDGEWIVVSDPAIASRLERHFS